MLRTGDGEKKTKPPSLSRINRQPKKRQKLLVPYVFKSSLILWSEMLSGDSVRFSAYGRCEILLLFSFSRLSRCSTVDDGPVPSPVSPRVQVYLFPPPPALSKWDAHFQRTISLLS